MQITPEQLKAISGQIAINQELLPLMARVHDYSMVRMLNPKGLTHSCSLFTTPVDLMRRMSDILGANYIGAIAIDQASGDDCVDAQGKTYEVKVVYVDAEQITISRYGNLVKRNKNGNGLIHTIQAKFRVYDKTAPNHHNKDTVLILISKQHNVYIGAFILRGDIVQEHLTDGSKNGVQRNISLNQFIKYGYEIGSMCHYIGWERYCLVLRKFILASEGKLKTEAECQEAFDEWVGLADFRNLSSLRPQATKPIHHQLPLLENIQ